MAIFSRLPHAGVKAFRVPVPQHGRRLVDKKLATASYKGEKTFAITDAARELVRAAADAEKRAKRRLTCAFLLVRNAAREVVQAAGEDLRALVNERIL